MPSTFILLASAVAVVALIAVALNIRDWYRGRRYWKEKEREIERWEKARKAMKPEEGR